MRLLVFEGSASEISEALKGLPAGSVVATIADAGDAGVPEDDDTEEEERQFVSVEVARRVLSRRSLSREQRAVLKLIYHAHPNTVAASELQSKIKYSKPEFAGFMGAFGRRLARTKGYVDGTWFFDNNWDDDEMCNLYRLPESVREAMRLEGLAP